MKFLRQFSNWIELYHTNYINVKPITKYFYLKILMKKKIYIFIYWLVELKIYWKIYRALGYILWFHLYRNRIIVHNFCFFYFNFYVRIHQININITIIKFNVNNVVNQALINGCSLVTKMVKFCIIQLPRSDPLIIIFVIWLKICKMKNLSTLLIFWIKHLYLHTINSRFRRWL